MDAMSLVQRFGKPDLFITVTCNPNWPEIKELLKYVDEPQNRPDLLARVFHARLEELKNDIFKRHIFGEVAAYAYVIEFQKRGLPHAHFLIILKSKFKITTPAHCDRFISAEIPNKETEPHLYNMVKKHMIHGPCGSLNPNCPCMLHHQQQVAPSCKNKYPRSFNDETTFDENSYPIYRRMDTSAYVVVRGHQLDNRWVVPYNPYLLAKFDCHINVEVCAGIRCVKYIYKYIYKGHDRISLSLYVGADVHEFDEIKEYQSARWVSPPEAAWRIYAFPISKIRPAVVHLQVHLQNYQYINFHGNDRLVNIVEDDFASRTMLTQFFYMTRVDEVAKKLNLLYIQFPEYFVWNNQKKLWTQRKKKEVIGRLVTVNPTEGERYYLRLLLMNVRTPKSFDNIKTVNGNQAVTFREAAENLGLLSGDHIVEKCLDEAVLYQMPSSFRRLFATLLIFCDISNPRNLWNKFKSYMCEDLLRTRLHTDDEVQLMVLQLIANAVEKMGKKIDDFNLVDNRLSMSTQEKEDREIAAEYNIQVSEYDLLCVEKLNVEQRNAFDTIMASIISNSAGVYFIDGPGGTGKTFLYKCLLATVRSRKWIALATASSGIAASILPGGRTAHSTFKIPIDGDDKYVCNIGKRTAEATLLKKM
ncbi:uncharacterized protein LOC116001221 [Ipomoea triloba]|uniref:uncharacterized protein LOC116001221 n=1 Tax=Ipomoea triloba TaxID=35885 RepID=UPI00125DFEAA|nr:uncharacterized protein LOC116001221 [Ipomoea triloba]